MVIKQREEKLDLFTRATKRGGEFVGGWLLAVWLLGSEAVPRGGGEALG